MMGDALDQNGVLADQRVFIDRFGCGHCHGHVHAGTPAGASPAATRRSTKNSRLTRAPSGQPQFAAVLDRLRNASALVHARYAPPTARVRPADPFTQSTYRTQPT